MTQAAPLQTSNAKPKQSDSAGLLLQRKCACGSTASALTGECEGCGQKRMVGLQTKLVVSEPGDRYEQEADRVADEVMRVPECRVQRQLEFAEKDDDLQMKPLESRESVQRQPIEKKQILTKDLPDHAQEVTSKIATQITAMRGSGQPLPDSVRTFYEPRFGVDFSKTRIHTGTIAINAARSLRARAFTVGHDMFFNTSEFQPATASGKRLLAHELTHVVQQAKGDTRPPRSRHDDAPRRSSDARMSVTSDATYLSPHQSISLTRPTVMRLSPASFQKRLGRTPDKKAVIKQLFGHPQFKKLWDWLGNCQGKRADHGPIKLRVGRTFEGGVQTFGGFSQNRGILTINPMIPAVKKNPQELVDAIVHELVHAISWAWRKQLCTGQKLEELGLTMLDIVGDDKKPSEKLNLKEPVEKGSSEFKPIELDKELDRFEQSGPSASDPCSRFSDIRAEPQAKIVEIIDDIQQRTGIGGPTRTKVNHILREEIRHAKQKVGTAEEILDAAPLLQGFRQCLAEECVKRPRKRNIARCFNQVLDDDQRNATQAASSQSSNAQPKQSNTEGAVLQPKLAISEPGDRYEQEADRIADTPVPAVQRQATGEDEGEELLQMKPLSDQITPLVQRQPILEDDDDEEEALQTKESGTQAPVVTPGIEASIEVLHQGGGQALDPATRAFMEPRFGHDFSGVRIHTDSSAANTSRLINARAFTIGHNVVFAPGQYDPESTQGRRLLAHELTHVVQQSIATRPTGSSANVFRALTELETNDGISTRSTEDVNDESTLLIPTIPNTVKRDADSSAKGDTGSNARKTNKCTDELSFSVEKLTPRLEPDKRGVQLNAEERLIIPNVVFQLNATVRADKHKRIKDNQVRQWKLGIIQNVHRSRSQLDYSDPQDKDNLIDCGLIDENETLLDCNDEKQKPWYTSPKSAFVRLPRFLSMSDRPRLERVDVVNFSRSILRRLQRDFKASAFVVAEKDNSFCVLSRVDWGFKQDDFFSPRVVVTESEIRPIGVGKIEKNLQLDSLDVHGPESAGVPLTSGECKPQPPWGECPDDTPAQQPTSQTSRANRRSEIGTRLAARVGRRTISPRSQEIYIQRLGADIPSTTPNVHRETVRTPDTTRIADESEVLSRSVLKEQIQNYQNACSEIATVKCVNGEIVEDIPDCIEKAPCGIAECVKQHEFSHAEDIIRLFQERLGRPPCKQKDGTPFVDGFGGFGNDFVSETGEDRTWKSFHLRSERKAYGIEVRCLRETRRSSKERLCKRALALEAAKSAFRRFLAAVGIDPGV